VLHTVAELGEHGVGNVERVLRDEVHAHAFAAHQAHDQFDPLDQCRWCVLEQQVGLVEEEHEFRLIQVAHLGQLFEQFGEHPQQERGVEPGSVHQLVGRENVHDPLAGDRLHEIGDVEHRLAEELVAALFLDLQQAALDGADARRADVAVFCRERPCVVAYVLQHRAKVFQVEQQQAAVVGNLEDQVQHAGLRVVERQHAGEQQRPHVAHRGAHGVALFAEDIPQGGGAGERLRQLDAALLQHGGELVADSAGLCDAGQVTLHVGHEHRHASVAEVLGEGLQRDGLAGAGGARDESVAVRQRGQQVALHGAMSCDQDGLGHVVLQGDGAAAIKSQSIR